MEGELWWQIFQDLQFLVLALTHSHTEGHITFGRRDTNILDSYSYVICFTIFWGETLFSWIMGHSRNLHFTVNVLLSKLNSDTATPVILSWDFCALRDEDIKDCLTFNNSPRIKLKHFSSLDSIGVLQPWLWGWKSDGEVALSQA